MYLFLNVAAFQVGWFACVLGAANGAPLLGPLVVAAIVALHLKKATRPVREATLIVSAGLLGASWDSALVSAGWLAYPSGMLTAGLAPYWIVAMWMLFATTLNVSMRWLRSRIPCAALLGGIAGPLAFYGGARLGGVSFLDLRAGLLALGIGWAVMMPLLILLSTRLDGTPFASEAEHAHV